MEFTVNFTKYGDLAFRTRLYHLYHKIETVPVGSIIRVDNCPSIRIAKRVGARFGQMVRRQDLDYKISMSSVSLEGTLFIRKKPKPDIHKVDIKI